MKPKTKKFLFRMMLLCSILLPGLGFSQISPPITYTTLPNNSSTQTGITLNGVEQWFRCVIDSPSVGVKVKLQGQGTTYKLSTVELFRLNTGGQLEFFWRDTLRTDSTILVAASKLTTPSTMYFRIISVNSPCSTCSGAAYPTISLSVMAMPVGCSAYVQPVCQLIQDGGCEYSNLTCSLVPNPNVGPCNYSAYTGFANCFWNMPLTSLSVNCGPPTGTLPLIGTSDYYYGCNTPTVSPHTGSGFMGAYLYTQTILGSGYTERDYREYITEPLASPLVPGKTYNLSMWVKRDVNYTHAISNIQMAFSNGIYTQSGASAIVSPAGQIITMTTTPVTSTVWTQLTASFVATSNYNTATIGNFVPIGSTNTFNTNGAQNIVQYRCGYYYFDDISLKPTVNNLTVTPVPASVCLGSSLTLTATTISPATYTFGSVPNDPTMYYNSADHSLAVVSPTTTTVYYAFATDNIGCASNATISVGIISPPNLVATASSGTLCLGGSSTLNASGSTAPYTWQPGGATGSSIVVTPTVTTTYTVSTFINGCGTYTKTLTINVLSGGPLVASVGTSNLYPCVGSGINLNVSASGGVLPYTYTWAAPLTSTTSAFSYTPTQSGNYSVVVKDFCNNSVTSSACVNVECTECCVDAIDIPHNTNLANITLNSQSYDVLGTINITGYVTCNNVTFRMNGASKILIMPGATLVLKGCRLFSCKEMWEGISLISNTSASKPVIMTDNTSIEDAYKAINLDLQGQNYNLQILAKNSRFNKNYIAFNVVNSNGIINNTSSINDACSHTSTNTATSPGGNLKCSAFYTPNSKGRSFAGVVFDALTDNLAIGSSSTTALSLYDNLDYGYYGTNSQVRITNSTFSNMSGPYIPGTQIGTAVASFNPGNPYNSSVLVQTCTFKDVYAGIYVNGIYSLEALKNTFSTTTLPPTCSSNCFGARGIEMLNAQKSKISENLMTNWYTGIASYYNIPISPTYSLGIGQNTITSSGSNITQQAITLNSSVSSYTAATASIVVANNVISNTYNGIVANYLKAGLRITNNTISLYYTPTGTRHGIRGNGIENANIDNNRITGNGTGNLNQSGIYLQLSPNNFTQCNTIGNIGRCVTYSGLNQQIIAGFVNNTLQSGNTGLYMVNNAIIGFQGWYSTSGWVVNIASNNTWASATSNWSQYKTFTQAPTTAQNSILYVQNNVNENPYLVGALPYNGGLIPGLTNYFTGGTNPTLQFNQPSPYTFPCPTPLTAALKTAAPSSTIAADPQVYAQEAGWQDLLTYTTTVNNTETNYLHKQNVYAMYKRPQATTTNTVFTNFVTQNNSSTVGKFFAVDQYILNGQYTQAQNVNNSTQNSLNIEKNHFTVNKQLLNGLINPSYVYTAGDLTSLQTIAMKCPLVDGNAVYQARTLLRVITGTEADYTTDCDNFGGSKMAQVTEPMLPLASPDQFLLYPNPNNGQMYLSYTLESTSKAQFKIYDAIGKQVFEKTLEQGSNIIQFKMDVMAEGVYYYNITGINNEVLKSDKLILIK